MIPIDIFDELEINESAEDLITYSDESLNSIESTVHKALKLLRKTNPKFDKNFYINVDKKIPYNSGLGGGSSDAGAVIRYLCDNYQLNLPMNIDIVREVGSDVPFFVEGVVSKVEGIGEIVNPIEIDRDLNLLIAVPKIGLSTKEVFDTYDTLSSSTKDIYMLDEDRNFQ
jgi:4-diphosphocytidyl-2-C-methyl-D-erythritol kinase